MGRFARASDGNQAAEIEKLRVMGYSVWVTSRVGKGGPDCVVAGYGINLLVEWKLNKKANLTPDEQEFHRLWQGPLMVATTAAQVNDYIVRHAVLKRA